MQKKILFIWVILVLFSHQVFASQRLEDVYFGQIDNRWGELHNELTHRVDYCTEQKEKREFAEKNINFSIGFGAAILKGSNKEKEILSMLTPKGSAVFRGLTYLGKSFLKYQKDKILEGIFHDEKICADVASHFSQYLSKLRTEGKINNASLSATNLPELVKNIKVYDFVEKNTFGLNLNQDQKRMLENELSHLFARTTVKGISNISFSIEKLEEMAKEGHGDLINLKQEIMDHLNYNKNELDDFKINFSKMLEENSSTLAKDIKDFFSDIQIEMKRKEKETKDYKQKLQNIHDGIQLGLMIFDFGLRQIVDEDKSYQIMGITNHALNIGMAVGTLLTETGAGATFGPYGAIVGSCIGIISILNQKRVETGPTPFDAIFSELKSLKDILKEVQKEMLINFKSMESTLVNVHASILDHVSNNFDKVMKYQKMTYYSSKRIEESLGVLMSNMESYLVDQEEIKFESAVNPLFVDEDFITISNFEKGMKKLDSILLERLNKRPMCYFIPDGANNAPFIFSDRYNLKGLGKASRDISPNEDVKRLKAFEQMFTVLISVLVQDKIDWSKVTKKNTVKRFPNPYYFARAAIAFNGLKKYWLNEGIGKIREDNIVDPLAQKEDVKKSLEKKYANDISVYSAINDEMLHGVKELQDVKFEGKSYHEILIQRYIELIRKLSTKFSAIINDAEKNILIQGNEFIAIQKSADLRKNIEFAEFFFEDNVSNFYEGRAMATSAEFETGNMIGIGITPINNFEMPKEFFGNKIYGNNNQFYNSDDPVNFFLPNNFLLGEKVNQQSSKIYHLNVLAENVGLDNGANWGTRMPGIRPSFILAKNDLRSFFDDDILDILEVAEKLHFGKLQAKYTITSNTANSGNTIYPTENNEFNISFFWDNFEKDGKEDLLITYRYKIGKNLNVNSKHPIFNTVKSYQKGYDTIKFQFNYGTMKPEDGPRLMQNFLVSYSSIYGMENFLQHYIALDKNVELLNIKVNDLESKIKISSANFQNRIKNSIHKLFYEEERIGDEIDGIVVLLRSYLYFTKNESFNYDSYFIYLLNEFKSSHDLIELLMAHINFGPVNSFIFQTSRDGCGPKITSKETKISKKLLMEHCGNSSGFLWLKKHFIKRLNEHYPHNLLTFSNYLGKKDLNNGHEKYFFLENLKRELSNNADFLTPSGVGQWNTNSNVEIPSIYSDLWSDQFEPTFTPLDVVLKEENN